jgi:hypothetical protein
LSKSIQLWLYITLYTLHLFEPGTSNFLLPGSLLYKTASSPSQFLLTQQRIGFSFETFPVVSIYTHFPSASRPPRASVLRAISRFKHKADATELNSPVLPCSTLNLGTANYTPHQEGVWRAWIASLFRDLNTKWPASRSCRFTPPSHWVGGWVGLRDATGTLPGLEF